MTTAAATLKTAMQARRAMIVPGAANALFARIIEDMGFAAIYVTGAGVANMKLGLPDLGLSTVTELAQTTSEIADATSLPLIVDIDTGFGNPLNVVRTVRLLERAGAAALQIEDQVFPKRCGHFTGKEVIPVSEMTDKIKAAVDSRRDHDLQIIARTDARAIEGLDAAIARAAAYAEAGADATFVEAPTSHEELARIPAALSVPQFANIVHGGRTPDPGQARLAEMGFSVALYANAVLQAAVHGAVTALGILREDGSLARGAGGLAGFDERQRLVGKADWDRIEARYAPKPPDG
jgi:2-methylisocitrate lyase-like PEP mutase family enzyme